MNDLYRFARWLVIALLAAMILTPWFYLWVQWASHHWGGRTLHLLAGHPFTRYFDRTWQAAIALGLGWEYYQGFRRHHAISWETLGLKGERPEKKFLAGLVLSLSIFALYNFFIFAMGWDRLRPSWPSSLGIKGGLQILAAALSVAFLEEIFFRGYFLGICIRAMGVSRAVVINIFFFAAIHFIHSPQITFPDGATWSSGFKTFFLFLQAFGHPLEIAPGFLVLALAAGMLCWSVLKSGGIFLAIGLHAGWILAIKMNAAVMLVSVPLPQWMLGGGDLSQGILALVPLTIEFSILRLWFSALQKRI